MSFRTGIRNIVLIADSLILLLAGGIAVLTQQNPQVEKFATLSLRRVTRTASGMVSLPATEKMRVRWVGGAIIAGLAVSLILSGIKRSQAEEPPEKQSGILLDVFAAVPVAAVTGVAAYSTWKFLCVQGATDGFKGTVISLLSLGSMSLVFHAISAMF